MQSVASSFTGHLVDIFCYFQTSGLPYWWYIQGHHNGGAINNVGSYVYIKLTFTLQAGVTFEDLYKFADSKGVTFIGGYAPDVGVSGGWVMVCIIVTQ